MQSGVDSIRSGKHTGFMKLCASTIFFTGLAMLSMAATTLVGATPEQIAAAPTVSGDWTVTVKVVIATGGVVLPSAFTLGVIFTRFRGSMERVSERLEADSKRFDTVERKLDDVKSRVDGLPCRAGSGCSVPHRK